MLLPLILYSEANRHAAELSDWTKLAVKCERTVSIIVEQTQRRCLRAVNKYRPSRDPVLETKISYYNTKCLANPIESRALLIYGKVQHRPAKLLRQRAYRQAQ